MFPEIWLSAKDIRKKKYPLSKPVSKLIQIKYDLGGAAHTGHDMFGYAGMSSMDPKPSCGYTNMKLNQEAFCELKELMSFRKAAG